MPRLASLLACALAAWAPPARGGPISPKRRRELERAAIEKFEASAAERDARALVTEAFAWLETTLTPIFANSHVPLHELSWPDLRKCGCETGARKIAYGSGVGAECVRDPRPEPGHEPGWDDSCGPLCLEHSTGHQVVQFCPAGWVADCASGCGPPPFEKLEERAASAEQAVGGLLAAHPLRAPAIENGTASTCGCRDAAQLSIASRVADLLFPITWGLRNGVACERGDRDSNHEGAWDDAVCGARCMQEAPASPESNEARRQREIAVFCPRGFSADCERGCVLPPLLQQPRPGTTSGLGRRALILEDALHHLLRENVALQSLSATATPTTPAASESGRAPTHAQSHMEHMEQPERLLNHVPYHLLIECGCDPDSIERLQFGSKIGVRCVTTKTEAERSELELELGVDIEEHVEPKPPRSKPASSRGGGDGDAEHEHEEHEGEACGPHAICTIDSIESVIFCPNGFVSDCKLGCVAPHRHPQHRRRDAGAGEL